ncbi:alpha/beta hydrolase [Actimicrobium sp. CCC2.4]|uniref:alpha/beta hydrolase n=1 Tax=Actimicrobium sp. CCC2.4 TaxID=3048606 RepID=UPI002AC90FB6|nr:alpha/beta hydrolase [Actimicrobium sp. CCC2.4]MEB0134092.1 alpha/beta hydrolase [Actimicrobium sp. CCC2.4]WPX31623.1 alpha/beta hydrolase [Actimicrobium sp. CCC2.4]
MNQIIRTLSLLLWMALPSSPALARSPDSVIDIPVRQQASVPVFWMPRPDAVATVIVLPGGGGSFGKLVDGVPTGGNFLVRSRDDFAARKLNVAVVGRPSDSADLDYAYRAGSEHTGDLQKVVATIRQLSGQRPWLIGTSRGTVSATAAAIAFGNEQLAGIVLSSSIVNVAKPGNVPAQDLSALRIPVLVLHHARDACRQCDPAQAHRIIDGLVHVAASDKQLMMVDGGSNPSGDTCGAQHWHGYIGMEKEAVDMIADWINAHGSKP